MIRCIGQGSYGEVWLAHNAVGTWRAVKIVYRQNFQDSRPYEREFSGIQRYEPFSRTNEGLIDVLQIGRNDEEGYFYYVMELADTVVNTEDAEPSSRAKGKATIESAATLPNEKFDPDHYVPKTLSRVIHQRGRLSYDECLTLGLTLNLALGHLHRHGLIHRDVKPSNIVFVNGVAKLTDIGLVTDLAGAESFVGTEGYIPPEGPNSSQADLYALGKVLYEASMGKDRNQFPEPVTLVASDGDSRRLMELNAVLIKACAPDPKARYQRAEEMNADLALLHNGESVRQKHALQQRVRFLTRAAVLVMAVLVLAVIPYSLAIRGERDAKAAAFQAAKDRERAKQEAKKKDLVAQFLKDMLTRARPSIAMGKDTKLLEELVDDTAKKLNSVTPDVERELRETLGQVYFELGSFEQSRDMFQRAYNLYAGDPSDPQGRSAAFCQTELAMSLCSLGELGQAETLAKRALEHRLRLPEDFVLDVADSYQCLGTILARAVQNERSEKYFQKALEIRRRKLPHDDWRVAESLNGVANALVARSDWPEAEKLFRESLGIYEAAQMAEQPNSLWMLNDLAATLQLQNKFAEAEETVRHALDLERKVLNTNHPLVATSLNRLARVLLDEHRLSEAKTNLEQALDIWLQRLDSQDLEISVDTVTALFDLLLTQHDAEGARDVYERVSAASRRRKGSKTLTYACGHYLARTGQWPEAAAEFQRLVELEPDSHEPYTWLSAVYVQLNDWPAYRELSRRAVARFASATNEPSISDRIAKSCLIVPPEPEVLKIAARLADACINSTTDNKRNSWFELCKGLSEFRLGHFEAAKKWAAKACEEENLNKIRDIEGFMVLAMAEHALGNEEAAKEAYCQGLFYAPQRMRDLSSGDIESGWKDWVLAHALMREAKEVFEPERSGAVVPQAD